MSTKTVADGLVEYREQLLRLAKKYFGNNDGAYPPEDLYADVCVQALKGADKFQDGTNLLAWLGTIMRNIYINWWRRERLKTIPLDGVDIPQKPSLSDPYMEEKIEKALRRLGKRRMEMVKMRLAGAGYSEIAEKLGVPVGTVCSGMKRSIEKLLHILKEAEDATGAKIAPKR